MEFKFGAEGRQTIISLNSGDMIRYAWDYDGVNHYGGPNWPAEIGEVLSINRAIIYDRKHPTNCLKIRRLGHVVRGEYQEYTVPYHDSYDPKVIVSIEVLKKWDVKRNTITVNGVEYEV